MPGRGAIFLVAGSLVSIIIFPLKIALASITILALGDAVGHVIGKFFGRLKNPLNKDKNIEGLIAAVIISILGAAYFVPWKIALLGSLAGMLVETPNLRFQKWKIDDNLTVPLVAGSFMWWLI